MAVNTFGKGRGVYISGLPYSFENSRVLYRAVLWSASAEEELNCWYSTNYNVEVHAYVKMANTVWLITLMSLRILLFSVETAAALIFTWKQMKSNGMRSDKSY